MEREPDVVGIEIDAGEVARGDPNHRHRERSHRERRPDRTGRPAELAVPQPIADHRHAGIAVDRIFVGPEETAGRGMDAQHREVVRRHRHHRHLAGSLAAAKTGGTGGEPRQTFDRPPLTLEQHFLPRDAGVGERAKGLEGLSQGVADHPRRLRHMGRRLEQQLVHQTDHGGRHAESEGEGQHHAGREARRTEQAATGVPHITNEVRRPVPAGAGPIGAAVDGHQGATILLQVAEPPRGLGPGGIRRHPGPHQRFGLLVEVEGNLLVDGGRPAKWPDHQVEQAPDAGDHARASRTRNTALA